MARFGVGLGADADLVAAAEVAVAAALDALGGRRPDLACVFVSGADPDDAATVAERAAAATQAAAVIGCTAAGVLGGRTAVEAAGAVSVWCAVLPGVRVRAFHLEVLPAAAGMAVVGLPEPRDDAVGLVLADPWSFPVDGFVAQSDTALPGLPLVGGLAAGPRGRGSTRLLLDGETVDRGAVGLLLGGPIGASVLVSQGCRPVGPVMTVTAADGNVLLGLAGAAAADKLEEVLAGLDAEAQAVAATGLQLGVAMNEYVDVHGRGDFLVRGIAGVEQSRDGLVVGDLVPVGATVQFQLSDAAAADADLRGRLRGLPADSGIDSVESALVFTGDARGTRMFGRPDHDLTVVREALAVDAVAGFFTAGEIAPVGGHNRVHGLSTAVLAFGSGAAADRGTRPGPGEGDSTA